MLDLGALDAASVHTDPCLFLVVPRFIRPEALAAVNRDFPEMGTGIFPPSSLRFGPAFADLILELECSELRAIVSSKLGVDLAGKPLQMDVKRFSESSDGRLHPDSSMKIVTALIYFNQHWDHPGGRLRICRSSWDIEDYAAEVPPEEGTLVMFKRSERSFHGFKPFEGERRLLQMYWVKPKRTERDAKVPKKLTLRRRVKRLLKYRPR
jgi:hypothetical protein